jgi:hypothetical protein
MSNLKFKHDVNSYAEAKELYESGVRDLAFNTRRRRVSSRVWNQPDAADAYQIVHYETAILTYYADGSVLINGAWVSSTTANRLQHYKPAMIERINRREFENGQRRARYIVTLANHPGEFDVWEGERYHLHPDATVVKV